MQPIRHVPNELVIGYIAVGNALNPATVEAWLKTVIVSPISIRSLQIAAERYRIEETVRDFTDHLGCDIVFTTGGVGLTSNDTVPEVTQTLATRVLPGVAEHMRHLMAFGNVNAIYNRGLAALRETPDHTALIVNLPDRLSDVITILTGYKNEDGVELQPGLLASLNTVLTAIGAPEFDLKDAVPEPAKENVNKVPVREEPKPLPQQTPVFSSVRFATPQTPQRSEATQEEREVPRQAAPVTQPLVREAPRVNPRLRMSNEAIGRRSVQRNTISLFPSAPQRTTQPLLDYLVEEPDETPICTMIWLHGLGRTPEEYEGFGKTLRSLGAPPIRFIYLRAPQIPQTTFNGELQNAWYDLKAFPGKGLEDLAGLKSMYLRISQLINKMISQGYSSETIFLGGFSQGAAMALYCALRQTRTLAGVLALSGYLPAPDLLAKDLTPAGKMTPFYIAHGAFDTVINPLLAKSSAQLVEKSVDTLIWREYNMDHDICTEEMKHIVQFISTALQN